jgi:two-component system response regulator FlrC
MGRGAVYLGDSAKSALLSYPWPGNVRELDNVLQRALIIQDGSQINASALGLLDVNNVSMMPSENNAAAVSYATTYTTDSEQFEVTGKKDSELAFICSDDSDLGSDLKQREYQIIISALRQQGGRRKETADVLGVSARTLRYKLARMRDIGINIDSMVSA